MNGFFLRPGPSGLELVQGENAKSGIRADFLTGPMRQLVKSAGRGQPLAKALGISGKEEFRVVDGTAGLGKDAIFLAALGCRVTAVEKNEWIHKLLEDGLNRARNDDDIGPLVSRIELVHADSEVYLKRLTGDARPDAVYLDPMFPLPKKSALPKKEMQIFRAFLEGEYDNVALLKAALAASKGRVVVKRPSWADPVLEPVQHRFEGKLVSFDSYLSSAG